MRRTSLIRLRGVRPGMKRVRQQHGEESGEKNTVEGSRAASGRTMGARAFGANVRNGGAADPILWFFLSHPHGADQAFGWPPVALSATLKRDIDTLDQCIFLIRRTVCIICSLWTGSLPFRKHVSMLHPDWARSARTLPSAPSLAKRPCDLQAKRTSICRGGPAAERRLWPRRRASSRAGAWPKTRSPSRSPLPSPARARERRAARTSIAASCGPSLALSEIRHAGKPSAGVGSRLAQWQTRDPTHG